MSYMRSASLTGRGGGKGGEKKRIWNEGEPQLGPSESLIERKKKQTGRKRKRRDNKRVGTRRDGFTKALKETVSSQNPSNTRELTWKERKKDSLLKEQAI